MLEVFLERVISFGLYWGIWLLVPLLIDITTAIIYFSSFIVEKRDETPFELKYYPPVTVIVPVYNSSDTLFKCLESIFEQSYPTKLIQVICVNNGSQDKSFEVFQRFHYQHPEMQALWNSLERSGKSIALNAGLYSGQGSYLINVDADTWLDRDAIIQVVKAFEKDSTLVAATGSIRVDKVLGEGSGFIDVINYCEVIEYLIAFEIGRRYQNIKNTVFSLSGAFSAFRRDIIMQSYLYQERTVSEDTDLTFAIRKTIKDKEGRIGCISEAIAYVEPIESMARLYSQRVRWQRGEMEVTAMYYEKVPNVIGALGDFSGRILISDHTLAFLRLAWSFLLPFLYFLGYPLPTVIVAMVGLLVCYVILDSTYFLVAYNSSPVGYQKELKKIWWVIFFLPLYRYLSYWYRVSGIIMGLTESKSWKVENPVSQLVDIVKGYIYSVRRWLGI